MVELHSSSHQRWRSSDSHTTTATRGFRASVCAYLVSVANSSCYAAFANARSVAFCSPYLSNLTVILELLRAVQSSLASISRNSKALIECYTTHSSRGI